MTGGVGNAAINRQAGQIEPDHLVRCRLHDGGYALHHFGSDPFVSPPSQRGRRADAIGDPSIGTAEDEDLHASVRPRGPESGGGGSRADGTDEPGDGRAGAPRTGPPWARSRILATPARDPPAIMATLDIAMIPGLVPVCPLLPVALRLKPPQNHPASVERVR